METGKIQLKLKSSVISPFHSDTLWGHICWALQYVYGENELNDFLRAYRTEEPPLIISNAFPKGYLPAPVLPPMNKERTMALVERFWGRNNIIEGISGLKFLSKIQYLSKKILTSMAKHELSRELVMEHLLGDPAGCPRIAEYLPGECQAKYKDGKMSCPHVSFSDNLCPSDFNSQRQQLGHEKAVVYHSKINRLSGTTGEGSLFTTEETFFPTQEFEIYCKLGRGFSAEKLRSCLEFITLSGYGKKKSSGKGDIECRFENSDPDKVPAEANAFMTLSNYVPSAQDPTIGYYRAFTKYGKLGGHFASSPLSALSVGANPTPFKYPLVMFEAGSIFKTTTHAMSYGRIVEGIHPVKEPEIVQYGIAYPLPLNVKFHHG